MRPRRTGGPLMCKACRNTYPKAHGDALRDIEAACKRAASSTPGAHGAWWEREPGYLAAEIVADRDKPSSKPSDGFPGTRKAWGEVWRETWEWAQQVNNRVTYDTRDAFLADLAALHRLMWEIPHPGKP